MEWIKTTVEKVKEGDIYCLRKNGTIYEKGKQRQDDSVWFDCWDIQAERVVRHQFIRTCWIKQGEANE